MERTLGGTLATRPPVGPGLRPRHRHAGRRAHGRHGVGIDPALITCDVDNVGSRTVSQANGGVLEYERDGMLRFWLPTSWGVMRAEELEAIAARP
jgi:hypothetical protein